MLALARIALRELAHAASDDGRLRRAVRRGGARRHLRSGTGRGCALASACGDDVRARCPRPVKRRRMPTQRRARWRRRRVEHGMRRPIIPHVNMRRRHVVFDRKTRARRKRSANRIFRSGVSSALASTPQWCASAWPSTRPEIAMGAHGRAWVRVTWVGVQGRRKIDRR